MNWTACWRKKLPKPTRPKGEKRPHPRYRSCRQGVRIAAGEEDRFTPTMERTKPRNPKDGAAAGQRRGYEHRAHVAKAAGALPELFLE